MDSSYLKLTIPLWAQVCTGRALSIYSIAVWKHEVTFCPQVNLLKPCWSAEILYLGLKADLGIQPGEAEFESRDASFSGLLPVWAAYHKGLVAKRRSCLPSMNPSCCREVLYSTLSVTFCCFEYLFRPLYNCNKEFCTEIIISLLQIKQGGLV